MSKQSDLDIKTERKLETVEGFKFEPIKGYPMLQWKGKRPFTSTQFYPAQLKENHGEPVSGTDADGKPITNWMSRIYWGDNLQVMSHLLKEFRGTVDLAYIDPPFDSKADYKMQLSLRGKAIENNRTSFEEKQYEDIWNNDEYLQFMYERITLIRELLKSSGSIMLHCDWNKSHHLRCILDEVFGPTCFLNEIYWYYYNKMPDTRKGVFPRSSDTILWYAKSKGEHVFNPQEEKRDKPVKQLARKKVDGRAVNVRDNDGNLVYNMRDMRVIDNVWRLSMLQPADKQEPTGYPTQKPETLLERAILAATNPGNLVFDCFMGSGTTQAVAMKLGRRFIGADINLGAIQTTTKRLISVAHELQEQAAQGELGENIDQPETKYFCGFSLYNVNHYDVFRNPAQAKSILIESLEIQPLPSNALYDGEKDGRMVKIMPVNRIATKADLNELLTGFDYKEFQKRADKSPSKPVESLLLVCMGHEPDLAAYLRSQCQGFDLDVEVVDILRDKANLEFKRDSQAEISVKKGTLKIEAFYPMNLLQKLSLQKENVKEWRELVESIMIDWNYDGAVFEPALVDVPEKEEFVKGEYKVPENAGTIRVKITDLLSESLEMEVPRG